MIPLRKWCMLVLALIAVSVSEAQDATAANPYMRMASKDALASMRFDLASYRDTLRAYKGDLEEAITLILSAVEKAGLKPGRDMKIAMDAAATEFFKDGKYVYEGEGVTRSIKEQAEYLAKLAKAYPIISIEDGLSEDDWDGWKQVTDLIGSKVQLVGDDLFVTNTKRLKDGIAKKTANSILVKVNQIGSLTETLEAVEMAQRAGCTAIISHRSGETEDATIADLAVATNAGQIKTGSASRSERVAKYNRLLRIADELGGAQRFGGTKQFSR